MNKPCPGCGLLIAACKADRDDTLRLCPRCTPDGNFRRRREIIACLSCGKEQAVTPSYKRSIIAKYCRHCAYFARYGRDTLNIPTPEERARLSSDPKFFLELDHKCARVAATGGYVDCLMPPNHPMAGPKSGGKVKEHRLILAAHLGRWLTGDESVHHKNGIRNDNRIENLELRVMYHGSGHKTQDGLIIQSGIAGAFLWTKLLSQQGLS